jgi:hypothetical protein
VKTQFSKKTHSVEPVTLPEGQSVPAKAKAPSRLTFLNLEDGPLDLNPDMQVRRFFQVIAESTKNNVAIVLTARSSGEGYEVDTGFLILPPELPFGALPDFIDTLETFADLGLETAVEDEE